MKISAVIITFNEEQHIAEAIRLVEWADEIVVIDSESTDQTRAIAASLGARVQVNKWPGFSAQKQLATDAAEHDWVFSLDADERVSDDLRNEIEGLRASGDKSVEGYRIPRLSYYMGKAIRHGGWYPDHQLRFFDRRKGRWNGAVIHESVKMEPGSATRNLRGEILHYTAENASYHQRMIAERYAPLGARKMLDDGRTTSPTRAVFAAWFTFIRTYFLKLGLLDGFPGFCIAYFAAHNTFLKHLMLLEIMRGDEPR